MGLNKKRYTEAGKLLSAVGDIDEDLIAETQDLYSRDDPKLGNTLLRLATACACVILIIGVIPLCFSIFRQHREREDLSGYALLYYYRSDALGDFAGSYIATEAIDVSQSNSRRARRRTTTDSLQNLEGMQQIDEPAPDELLPYLGDNYKVYACENGTRLYVASSGEMYIDLGVAGVYKLEKNN